MIRAYRDGLAEAVSREAEILCKEDLTQQSFKTEVDVNVIVKRFGLTGELPVVQAPLTYGDLGPHQDLHSALNVVRDAEQLFAQLPARLRERFGNDGGEFLRWLEDPANDDEAVRLGLLTPVPRSEDGAGPAEVTDS